jgi:hypothetical protein
MRSIVLSAALVVLVALAAPSPARSQTLPVLKAAPAAPVTRERPPEPPHAGPCCVRKVWDAHGHEIGDVIDYDARFNSQPLGAYVAYRIKGGDAVPLGVIPERFYGFENQGGGTNLFTTPDCSGPTMFAMLYYPALAKRYGTVLNYGYPAGPFPQHAWLFVTDPLPVRGFPPAGTVFHSQFDGNTCQPYPPPGYTINPASGVGGYPMHRVEDLLAKYTRPFYINY